jgi:hypothetical protein
VETVRSLIPKVAVMLSTRHSADCVKRLMIHRDTARRYRNGAVRHRPHPISASLRLVSATGIDRNTTRSRRAESSFDPGRPPVSSDPGNALPDLGTPEFSNGLPSSCFPGRRAHRGLISSSISCRSLSRLESLPMPPTSSEGRTGTMPAGQHSAEWTDERA